MSDLRKAAEMALELLTNHVEDPRCEISIFKTMLALRLALAQPEQKWDSYHPKAQALIRERARLRIELGLVERLVDDPHFETTPSDMEYWGPLHDRLVEALTQLEQEPVAAHQALEALDELESCARGDEPFNHFAAPLIRQFIEQALAQPEQKSVVYQCPRCATSMDVDLNAKPVDTVNISQERVDETAKCGHKAVGLSDRDRLEEIISVICRYLPPDGIDIKTAMSKIIELIDPLPPKREWVGLSDEEVNVWSPEIHAFIRDIEAKLKEKNT